MDPIVVSLFQEELNIFFILGEIVITTILLLYGRIATTTILLFFGANLVKLCRVLAMVLALRAFVDHLVVLGLKKVISSTSDKDFISGNMSLDFWILVFPLKLKDLTITINCIFLASISLLSLA